VEAFQGLEIPLHHRGSRLLGLSSFISALCTRVRGRVFLRTSPGCSYGGTMVA
jgi:hypothetical protein